MGISGRKTPQDSKPTPTYILNKGKTQPDICSFGYMTTYKNLLTFSVLDHILYFLVSLIEEIVSNWTIRDLVSDIFKCFFLYLSQLCLISSFSKDINKFQSRKHKFLKQYVNISKLARIFSFLSYLCLCSYITNE